LKKQQIEKQREERKQKGREKMPILLEQISAINDTQTIDEIDVSVTNSTKFCFTSSDKFDEFFHINFGKKLAKNEPNSVYVGIFESGPTIRVIVFAGEEASRTKNAGLIAKAVSEILGGAGGGDAKFAQGGGKDTSKKDEAIAKAKSMVLG